MELKLDHLEKESALKVLYSLKELGTQNKQALTSSVSPSTHPVRDRLRDDLEPLGLVNVEIVREGRRTEHFVSLTEKGEEIAELVVEIENILNRP